ncbi:MAG TPA: glutamate racemase [Candidatus Krumholzibacteria bacterium]|nr:glutamate racemase [Candidatus Krumholzibacteria bacterium]
MDGQASQRPIGVFDSGLGGLTVLRALHERLPGEDLLYFGDTARVPYGTKGEKTVRAFARQDAGVLVEHGVKMVVVACNTASAFALEHLREVLPVPVLGVIEPGVTAALAVGRGGPVGVIGTSGTIRSGRYQEGLRRARPDAVIVARECPLFVPLVEEGLAGHAMTAIAADEYLAPLREAAVDTLILGCTHYPLLKDDIARVMGPQVALVDSAEVLAAAAERLLTDRGLRRGDAARAGTLSFILSDIPWKFAEIGARFLGKPIDDVRTVGLDEMEEAGHRLAERAGSAVRNAPRGANEGTER